MIHMQPMLKKHYRLYRKFWRCLNWQGVWQDEEYLRKKAAQAVGMIVANLPISKVGTTLPKKWDLK